MANPKTPEANNHLLALDILRGLAALAVFSAHFAQQFLPMGELGWIARAFGLMGVMGVAIFFVLSGFLIHLGTIREEEKTGRVNWKHYARRRFLRIYPAYIAALIGYAIFVPMTQSTMVNTVTLKGFITHALLISSFYTDEYNGISGIFWTVIVECHFYAIYPLVYRTIRKIGAFKFFLTAWIFGMAYFFGATLMTQAGEARVMLQMTAPALFWKWILGIVLAQAYVAFGDSQLKRSLKNPWLIIPVMVLLFAGTIPNNPSIELNYTRFALPFICMAVVGLLLFSPLRSWRSRMGEWLGQISYSVYLWHPLALALIATWPMSSTGLNLTASLALSLLVAACSYYLIERPAMRFGKPKIWAPMNPDAKAAKVTEQQA